MVADTSAERCAIALFKDSRIIIEKEVTESKGHSEIFFVLLEKVLAESKINLNQITGFGVCTGPGNFTSLRVAIAAIRGLSLACGKPSVGVSAFDTLALDNGPCLVLIKGRGATFYGQEFLDGNQLSNPKFFTMDSIAKEKFSSDCKVIGYQSNKVCLKIGSRKAIPTTSINLLRLAQISKERIAQNSPRPTPLYIQ